MALITAPEMSSLNRVKKGQAHYPANSISLATRKDDTSTSNRSEIKNRDKKDAGEGGGGEGVEVDVEATTGSGYFEVQILSLTNNRGTLVDGRCCGGGRDSGGRGGFPPCSQTCTTAFWLCLKEYQSNVTAIGSCSFGNVSSQVLGQNTFTLIEPVTLQLHFTFRWTYISSTKPAQQRTFEAEKIGLIISAPTIVRLLVGLRILALQQFSLVPKTEHHSFQNTSVKIVVPPWPPSTLFSTRHMS
ncbi:Similar to Jag1: Protein jagged-1 (Rattus norvegicus) [Cotesia congregata]|uniref:Similar to Jag1: Protein jagged-1 (Rattus norvegicus) n=1 Tax=Cotesia congregata TaxID=51543 RepID=A0A8J2HPL7_COTCN|nr:Similar to Jag1: Protein jagged-1 (Rattus norvegicus) [Cotesia congregata]